jgi:hypothetical protein
MQTPGEFARVPYGKTPTHRPGVYYRQGGAGAATPRTVAERLADLRKALPWATVTQGRD